jgi:hypothetical protein
MIINETGYMIVNELAPTRGGQVMIRSIAKLSKGRINS